MKKYVFLLLMSVFALATQAQKVKLAEGKLDFLKGQEVIKLKFTYDKNMKLGKQKFEDYISKKVNDKNKKNPGSGDEWKQKLTADFDTAFPHYFSRMFNIMMKKQDVKLDTEADDAPYTMIVNTIYIEPGYNIGIKSKRAQADMEVFIVKKDDPEKTLAKFNITKSPGSSAFGPNYSFTDRVGGCYENAASRLAGYFLQKKTFKKKKK